MSKPRDERQKDLFWPALDAIIDLNHPLVRLAQEIDWEFLSARFGSGYAIAGFIFVCALISLAAASALKDHTNKDLTH